MRLPRCLPRLVLFACLFPGADAPGAEQEKRVGGATAVARLDHDALTLADTLVLTIRVEGRAPLEIEPVKAIVPSPAWVVAPLPGPVTRSLPDRRMRWEQTYRVSPLQNGDVSLPLAPLRIRTGGTDMVDIPWDAFKVKVSTVVSAPALGALKDITPPERLPEPPAWPWGMTAAIAGVAAGLVVAVWGAWRASHRPPPRPAELPPGAWAAQELTRIEGLNLPATGQVEVFHILIGDVVRQYLDRRFGVRTVERTSAEVLAGLDQANSVAPELQVTLRSFLERCDLAKFARLSFAPEECQESLRLARTFVEQSQVPTGAPPGSFDNSSPHPSVRV